MTNKQLAPKVRAWLKSTDVGPEDVRRSVGSVSIRAEHTRQRGRWWPLPSFRRGAASQAARTDTQPSPIPASNGHTPTVIGRTSLMLSPVKAITAGAIVFAIGGVMLIAQPFQQQSSVPGAATDDRPAATVSGDMESVEVFTGEVTGEVIDGLQQDHWENTGRLEVSDDRLTGDFTEEGTMNRYQPIAGEGAAEVWYGTLRVENDGGTWEGTHSGCSSCGNAGDGSDISYVELVGSGGYEGLSAILFVEQRPWTGVPEPAWVNGVIIPGDVPPA